MREEHTDAWSQTIALLDQVLARKIADAATQIAAGQPRKSTWDDHAALTVRVVERTGPRTVSVSWCDPLSGHYGCQSWRVSLARRHGSCVLSGDPIRRGDSVYQPSSRSSRPSNAGAMISASRVDAALRAGHQPVHPDVATGTTSQVDFQTGVFAQDGRWTDAEITGITAESTVPDSAICTRAAPHAQPSPEPV